MSVFLGALEFASVITPGENVRMTEPTAQESPKAVLRERLGPVLRSAGFKGSAPTWTLTQATGDRAIVNVQSSDSSSTSKVMFIVNTAVVPLAWWRWTNYQLGKSESRSPKEYDGLWRKRVHARRQQALARPEWWSVTDLASAECAIDDVVQQMDDGVIAGLRRLLEPGAVLEVARSGQLGEAKFDTRGAIAVLLTDSGPSDELQRLLNELETLEDARLRAIFWPMVQWCRETTK
jgi:hypothetical protein